MDFNKKSSLEKEKDQEPSLLDSLGFILENEAQEETSKDKRIGLFGEIDEEKTSEIIYSLNHYKNAGRIEEPEKTPANNNKKTKKKDKPIRYSPIEFFISTYGGGALEMFAIYDVMRSVRDECEIHTKGLGKVMSAGVLLLAAGSKGNRHIGANCRIMLHSVVGGQHGPVYNLENEFEEIKWTQEQYITALAQETSMTKRYIKNLLARKVNVYLTAKEAVELGIADKII
jgi:ATP-dependent Clp endopeptidase proteolytic subunit ClpP